MEEYPKIYLYRRIVQAKLFIDEHFDVDIDLENIADEACFSKFHFIRVFKTIYEKTPHQYLIFVRIEKAKLLLEKNSPASSVCYTVGFDSVTTFTGLFKRMVGSTPAVFQKQKTLRNADIAMTPLKYIPNCFAEMKGWVKK